MHINFYEDWDTAEDVAAGLIGIQRLLEKLEPLIDWAHYLINPASNMVHREGYCPDAQKYGDNWKPIGYFPSLDVAAEANGTVGCTTCSYGG